MNVITDNWKAVVAAVVLALANLVQTSVTDVDGGVNAPNTTSEWIAAVVTTVFGALAVWAKGNTNTVP